MKYSITIDDMDTEDLARVVAFLNGQNATPATPTNVKGRQAIAELAAAAGATTSGAPAPTPPAVPHIPTPAAPGNVNADPFAVPPSPAANVSNASAGSSAVAEIDSKGTPYNGDFHAPSKRKTNDGSWALKKGVDKDKLAAWLANRTAGTPTPPATPAAPTAAELNAKFAPHLVQPATPPAPQADPFAAPPAPSTPPAPVAPTPPAPVAELKVVDYPTWHAMYTNLLTAGKLTGEIYTAIAKRYNAIEDIMIFYNDADARSRSYAEFEALAAA